jgi:hypothetical protein
MGLLDIIKKEKFSTRATGPGTYQIELLASNRSIPVTYQNSFPAEKNNRESNLPVRGDHIGFSAPRLLCGQNAQQRTICWDPSVATGTDAWTAGMIKATSKKWDEALKMINDLSSKFLNKDFSNYVSLIELITRVNKEEFSNTFILTILKLFKNF